MQSRPIGLSPTTVTSAAQLLRACGFWKRSFLTQLSTSGSNTGQCPEINQPWCQGHTWLVPSWGPVVPLTSPAWLCLGHLCNRYDCHGPGEPHCRTHREHKFRLEHRGSLLLAGGEGRSFQTDSPCQLPMVSSSPMTAHILRPFVFVRLPCSRER